MNISHATEFTYLESLFKPYISRDRAIFLQGVSDKDLITGTVLDFQHQTILRLWLEESCEHNSMHITSYLSSLETRIEILHQLKSRFCFTLEHAEFEQQIPKAGMRFTTLNHVSLARSLKQSMNSAHENEFCYFVNNSGIGLFSTKACEEFDQTHDVFETTVSISSTGASMYYAFNTSSSRAYLQTKSIDILAASISAIQHDQHISKSLQQSQISEALTVLPKAAKCPRELAKAFKKMFGSHELGHRPLHNGNQYLVEILASLKLSEDLIYRVGFPSDYDLQSWQRIKNGRGSVRDMLFILGDTLANVAFLQDAPSLEVVGALRIFLSWLAKEPKSTLCPRGNVPLLLCLYENTLPLLINDIEQLIVQCAREPEFIAQKLFTFEQIAWTRFRQTLW